MKYRKTFGDLERYCIKLEKIVSYKINYTYIGYRRNYIT